MARPSAEFMNPPQIPTPTVPPRVRANWLDDVATPRSDTSTEFWTTTRVASVTNPIPKPVS